MKSSKEVKLLLKEKIRKTKKNLLEDIEQIRKQENITDNQKLDIINK